MTKTLHFPLTKRIVLFCTLAAAVCLMACSPKYNWREVHGKDASFVALFPDKPVTVTRTINLDGQQLPMTMSAAEVDGVSFAIGCVTLADGGNAASTLQSMKTAMLRNIQGKLVTNTATQNDAAASNDIEALGFREQNGAREPLLMLGRFAAKGNHLYQVIVLGDEKAVVRDEAHTFLTSFQPG